MSAAAKTGVLGGERTDAGLVPIALREAGRTVASWRPLCLKRKGGGEPGEPARQRRQHHERPNLRRHGQAPARLPTQLATGGAEHGRAAIYLPRSTLSPLPLGPCFTVRKCPLLFCGEEGSRSSTQAHTPEQESPGIVVKELTYAPKIPGAVRRDFTPKKSQQIQRFPNRYAPKELT